MGLEDLGMMTEGHQAGGERGGLAFRVPAWRWGVSHIAVAGPDSTHLFPITGFAFLRAISLPFSGAWNQAGSQVASLHPKEGVVPAQPSQTFQPS